jgi:hypothetical protein
LPAKITVIYQWVNLIMEVILEAKLKLLATLVGENRENIGFLV